MKALLWMVIIITIILIGLIILNLIKKKTFSDREKSSPFKCGFDPKNSARLPFSLQFFLIAVIFLIFDVEITFILPLVLTMKSSNLMTYTFIVTLFILILLLGLYHESKQGALNWEY